MPDLERTAVPWRQAMQQALYGRRGFYRRPDGPRAHFRTSATHPDALAAAVHRLAADLDDALGHPDGFAVVDVGAGHGELLAALAGSAPGRWSLQAVEVAGRPAGLPARIGWTPGWPSAVVGLVVAHELLDVLPVDVVVATDDGPRLLLVEPDGVEHEGPPPSADDLAWLDRWWPLPAPGCQAEVGRPRDVAWRSLVGSLTAGAALAVDYDHVRERRPAAGSLTGYRLGRQVRPAPDGSCDLTAHVALDACAAAAADLADGSWTGRQHEALSRLGVTGGPAAADGFGWLLQTVGARVPGALRT